MLLTRQQLGILQHSLGVDQYGQGRMYRNHFCAGPDDEPTCRKLVEMGYMRVWHPNETPLPYYNCTVTDSGKQAVRDESPAPPKLSRAQIRYWQWLMVRDAFPDWSFCEWLKVRGYDPHVQREWSNSAAKIADECGLEARQ